jgi:predicted transcriptional regulator
LSGEEMKEFSVYLKGKGLTIEEIAKHLHRGKTEIELLLKFHQ